jgi:hypothetical protein
MDEPKKLMLYAMPPAESVLADPGETVHGDIAVFITNFGPEGFPLHISSTFGSGGYHVSVTACTVNCAECEKAPS